MGYKNDSVMDSPYYYAPSGDEQEGRRSLNEIMAEFANVSTDDLVPLIRYLMCAGMSMEALTECSCVAEEMGPEHEEQMWESGEAIAESLGGACLEFYCRSHPCPDTGRHDVDEETMACKKCQMDFKKALSDSMVVHLLNFKARVDEGVEEMIQMLAEEDQAESAAL